MTIIEKLTTNPKIEVISLYKTHKRIEDRTTQMHVAKSLVDIRLS